MKNCPMSVYGDCNPDTPYVEKLTMKNCVRGVCGGCNLNTLCVENNNEFFF